MIEIDFLDELDRFQRALDKNSVEVNQGEQKSDFSGQGMIFKDHKKYVPGDDIRKIDWKAYARTKELFVKRFQEEKNVTLHIVVDRSSSMDYGSVNKYEYAAKIGLGLAYMANKTNDRFRYSVFSETLTDLTAARRNANLGQLVDTMNSLRKTPESQVGECLTQYSSRIKNKSIVVILSDFLVDIEKIEDALQSLAGSEVVLVQTLSGEEMDPDMKGDKILEDPESSSTLRTYLTGKVKSKYQSKLQNHIGEIQEKAAENKADFVQVNTEDEFFESFFNVWQRLNR
ncbi:DUF58 domain-containing protein [Candidatus Nanohalobium constans]|uniref:DUF58 domain-containing protein n=1 Tax=Candidatus Nanohalobium constans TaxID=2565781 RepID=A0A5Q0UGE3_9ARCH|nr:DUF58 domain-containing protein [Candidatus Nanohalobium constans]QGA80688.1 DUF58 domain-containing protein [Candidatus Nanohalobium constans]